MVKAGGFKHYFFAVITLVTLLISATAQGQSVDRPAWKPGAIFHYETFDLIKGEVLDAEEQRVLSVDGDQAEVEVLSAKRGTKEVRRLNIAQHTPMSRSPCFVSLAAKCKGTPDAIRFPGKVGDKWKYKFEFESGFVAGALATWDITAEIDGWEDVKVPAGTFRTLRIEHDGYWERTGDNTRGRIERVYWYAPDVGRVVKQSNKVFNRVGWTDTREEVRLTKYLPAPDDASKAALPEAKKE